MKLDDYLMLGTSNKREETREDHIRLRQLFDLKWEEILGFSSKSADEIKTWQFQRIKKIVRHAFDTVPLYRQKYEEAGFCPEDLKRWEDFEGLPILTKDELVSAFPKSFLSSSHNLEFTTRSSGSSGKFVTLAVSPDAIYLDTIYGARQLVVQSMGKHTEKDTALFIYTSPWWVESVDGIFPTQFIPTTTTIENTVRSISNIRPKTISVYPTYLEKIASKGYRLSDAGVELVIVHSEQSTPWQRKSLAEATKVPVLDEFSSEELTRIALECPENAYHLEEDACYVEILDVQTMKPCVEDTRGLVIGTNLMNEATPVIRYSQRDLAAISRTKNCSCGSHCRQIKSIDGRVMDSFRLSNGELIPAGCFMDLAYNWYLELDVPIHGMTYQIVQSGPEKADIYIVQGSFLLSRSQKTRIGKSMFQLLPEEFDVNVHVVAEPPYKAGAKYRPVISLEMQKNDK